MKPRRPAQKAAPAAAKRASTKKKPAAKRKKPAASNVPTVETSRALPPGRALPIEIDPRRVEDALLKVKSELMHWANKGRYTRVRFKFRGKQLLPDLPLAAVVAAESLTFYWGGILRALIVNFAGKTVLDV